MSQRTAKNLLFCKIFVGFFINNFGVPSINFQSMKKFILFLFLISTAFAGREQNLVPNGGLNCIRDARSIRVNWIQPYFG
jgi:hypothetical protein